MSSIISILVFAREKDRKNIREKIEIKVLDIYTLY